jgi:tRNA threonylcarbamoyladenosine biosynthesis protein TsaE
MPDGAPQPAHPPLVPPLADHGALAMTEAELRDWGRRFGRSAHPPLIITFTGELGAGKTTFVRAAARELRVTDPVASPTYTVGARHAAATGAVSHLDLYRSSGLTMEELVDLEPYLDDAVVFVEWPAAGRGVLPAPRALVELRHQGGDARLIVLSSDDPALLEAVARSLS